MISYMRLKITEGILMKRIKTITTRDMAESKAKGGCGECQTSCQSASKTSCSVANQHCEQRKDK
jgi:predicted ribosomally synthesized six-cysteine peptide SCIFF